MTTFPKLSAKHYGVDEFNYIDNLNSQTQTFFLRSLQYSHTHTQHRKSPHNIPSPQHYHGFHTPKGNNPKLGSKISKMLKEQFGMIPFEIFMMSLNYF